MASLRPVSRSRASRTTALALLLSASVAACGDPGAPTAVTSSTPGLAAELTEPGVTAGLTVYGLGALRRATPQSPCAEGAFRQFDFWVGDWIATSAGGPPGGTPSRITTALDGCAILEQWGGGGRSLNSYDPETGLWHQTWVPGAGRFPFRMAGGLQPDGDMVLRGVRHPWFAPNASWIDVYTWTPVDADHVIQAFTFDVVPGGFHLQGQLGYERTANLPPINPPSTTRCQPGGEAGETRLLDFTLGRWTVSAANGLELGTSVIALDPVLSGCLLEEKFTTANGYEAIGWMYYDPVVNAFYRSYVDSEGERLELRGEVSSSPVALEGAEPIPGASDARVRLTWTSVSADRLEQRWELSKDDGATWREVQTLVFRRA
jgi:hypothetical protein